MCARKEGADNVCSLFQLHLPSFPRGPGRIVSLEAARAEGEEQREREEESYKSRSLEKDEGEGGGERGGGRTRAEAGNEILRLKGGVEDVSERKRVEESEIQPPFSVTEIFLDRL